jgi:hypothetical protein
MILKSIFKKPFLKIKKIIRNSKNKTKESEEIFTEIYDKHLWSGVSKSGPGSDLTQTEKIRYELPKLLKNFKISSILDIPCGDFYWMKHVDLDSISYIGGDVVEKCINQNKTKYSDKNKNFLKLNVLKDQLPKVDLIFCRDLLVHFSNKDINQAIMNFKKSNSKYLLTTSFGNKINKNITTGDWVPINLMSEPFNFPTPLQTINENCSEGSVEFSDKSLCLWKLSEI